MYSPAMELPPITKRFTRFQKRKTTKESVQLSGTVPPPSEETISQLNQIGQEYPFCVYYKQKVNDPL